MQKYLIRWELVNPPSRALKTPRRGVFARRDARRRARAVRIHQRSLIIRLIKKTRYFLKSTSFWWELVDSNHRSITQQIYSLSPLATRESSPIQFFDCNLADCSIIITKTSKKSKPFFQKSCFIAFLQQCFSKSRPTSSLLWSFFVKFLS